MNQPVSSFKENLQSLPSIDGIGRLELLDAAGDVVASFLRSGTIGSHLT